MMPFILVTVGPSSSGKSTFAESELKKWRGQVVEVNRDNTRKSLYGIKGWSGYKFNTGNEGLVTLVNRAAIQSALSSGKSVIISDTNLKPEYREDFKTMADAFGAEYKEMWFPVDLEELHRRNEKRGAWRIPSDVLTDMHSRFVGQYDPEVHISYTTDFVEESTRVYVPDTTLPKAVIFDVDGTLMSMDGNRKPYEWHKVIGDVPKMNVVNLARNLAAQGIKIVVTSGRDSVCRDSTTESLTMHGIPFHTILMRKAGDQRGDDVVKEEIFWNDIAPNYNVLFSVDDRNRVVDKWRSLGIECWQVAPGDF
jgi:predicted kinase